MQRLRPSSEAEMIAVFLRTELPAARFRDKLQALLDQAGLPERLITAPNLDDPAENQARVATPNRPSTPPGSAAAPPRPRVMRSSCLAGTTFSPDPNPANRAFAY